jgi:antitoxin (DNA-binding transcriptional repressor) of toxin-antitoxin stability system
VACVTAFDHTIGTGNAAEANLSGSGILREVADGECAKFTSRGKPAVAVEPLRHRTGFIEPWQAAARGW